MNWRGPLFHPLAVDGPLYTYPHSTSHKREVTNLVVPQLDPSVLAALSRFGFGDPSTIRVDACADGTAQSHSRTELGPEYIERFRIIRPSFVPKDVSDRYESLKGVYADLIALLITERNEYGILTTYPEVRWEAPAGVFFNTLHAAASRVGRANWEFRLSQAARPHLELEISSLPVDFWKAMNTAREQAQVALDRHGDDDLNQPTSSHSGLRGLANRLLGR